MDVFYLHTGQYQTGQNLTILTTEDKVTKAEFEARIKELQAKGISPRIAERIAKKERRLQSPQHKKAVARRVEMATIRFEATGKFNL